MKGSIKLNKFLTSGTLQDKYCPLQNLLVNDVLTGFQTSKIIYNFQSPIEVDCQLSYDDSLNLIINNNQESPKLINSTFAKLGNDKYEYIIRNQKNATNLYDEESLLNDTDLFIRSFTWPIIDLKSVKDGGQLMGGNYIFYIKYCDEDGNESDIMSESGCISITHGNVVNSIHGTLADERTSKQIELVLSNLDTSFSQFSLYFTRETSDLNGLSVTKCYKLDKSYSITDTVTIIINGYENVFDISPEDLNIKYNYYNSAKTQASVQNMLFLGNVKSSACNNAKLQQLSYQIKVSCKQKWYSLGWVNSTYNDSLQSEYYDPLNIYYYLGYWPEEYYKLGVVYLLNDGTTSQVFNLLGCDFTKLELNEYNEIEPSNYTSNVAHKDFPNFYVWNDEEILPVNTRITNFHNTSGIFKTFSEGKHQIINHRDQTTRPLYFEMCLNKKLQKQLKDLGVVGYFFVRQKRIPTSLFQAVSVGIDKISGYILPRVNYNYHSYRFESLTDSSGNLTPSVNARLMLHQEEKTMGLLALDPMVIPSLQAQLIWNNYTLKSNYKGIGNLDSTHRHIDWTYLENIDEENTTSNLVYINENVPSFYIGDFYFSTKVGNEHSVRDLAFIGDNGINDGSFGSHIRGTTCPIIGTNKSITDKDPSKLYTIQLNYNDDNWMDFLLNNQAEYYAISNRYNLSSEDKSIDIYRGDCFTNTVTIRLTKNFIDPELPTNNIIIDEKTLYTNFKGVANSDTKWEAINLGDLNAVPIGMWMTYKCLSNYNLGFRSLNKQDVTYMEQLGSYGSFYPLSGISTKSINKHPESKLLNEGYSVTLGRKVYHPWQSVPYENYHYENRIAFSNVASTKMFTNGFRVFQGMSYQDIDKQFGSITKLLPYGQNLLCVFEHGIGIVPVNEKALLSTQQGMSIHLYGAGVLQEQVSVISPDYGSTWMDSIIQTPNAFYGVDSHAKKIWKFNNSEGFLCISDFKVQSYLNDTLNLENVTSYFYGVNNITTHFNNFKGDVIFTIYCKNDVYTLCYNEILKTWTSRFSWSALLSANIDNHFYSFDQKSVYDKLKLYKHNQTGEISCKQIYHKGVKIPLYYKHELWDDAILSVSKVTIGNIEDSDPIVLEPVPFEYAISENEFVGFNLYPKTSDKVIRIWTTDNPLNELDDNGNQIVYPTVHIKDDGSLEILDETNDWYEYSNSNQLWCLEYTGNKTTINPEDWKGPYKREVLPLNTSGRRIFSDNNHIVNDIIKGSSHTDWIKSNVNDNIDNETIWVNSVIPFINCEKLYCIYVLNINTGNEIQHELHIDSLSGSLPDCSLDIEFDIYSNTKKGYIPATKDNKSLNLFFVGAKNPQFTLWKHDINSPITNWYGNQEPFELEFIVNQPSGMHKIFNNLVIISNNVEPDSLEVEILGDVFDFPKEAILNDSSIYSFPEIFVGENKKYYTTIKKDRVTQEYSLLTHQDCLNINNFGRRLGNISYIEGKWHLVLQPIYYNHKDDKDNKILKTTRLRDKWAKIRIKYSGEKLAIITAIQTLMNISYV